MDAKRWIVTENAGPQVAGRSVTKGETIELTEHQARAEVIAGSLKPAPNAGDAAEPETVETTLKPLRKRSGKTTSAAEDEAS
ncbi:hypothetical protein [Amorphus sp. MBR-141]